MADHCSSYVTSGSRNGRCNASRAEVCPFADGTALSGRLTLRARAFAKARFADSTISPLLPARGPAATYFGTIEPMRGRRALSAPDWHLSQASLALKPCGKQSLRRQKKMKELLRVLLVRVRVPLHLLPSLRSRPRNGAPLRVQALRERFRALGRPRMLRHLVDHSRHHARQLVRARSGARRQLQQGAPACGASPPSDVPANRRGRALSRRRSGSPARAP